MEFLARTLLKATARISRWRRSPLHHRSHLKKSPPFVLSTLFWFSVPFSLSLRVLPENHVPALRGDPPRDPRRRRSRGLGSARAASEPCSVVAQGRRGSRRGRLQALRGSLAGGGRCQSAWRQDGRHSMRATLQGGGAALRRAVAIQRLKREREARVSGTNG